MAIIALSLQWHDAKPSAWLAACALVSTHVMLYFKEPLFAFVLTLAGARLILRWWNMPPDRRSLRSAIASSPVDLGIVLLALGFLALYFGTKEQAFTHRQVRPVAWSYGAIYLLAVIVAIPFWRALGLVP